MCRDQGCSAGPKLGTCPDGPAGAAGHTQACLSLYRPPFHGAAQRVSKVWGGIVVRGTFRDSGCRDRVLMDGCPTPSHKLLPGGCGGQGPLSHGSLCCSQQGGRHRLEPKLLPRVPAQEGRAQEGLGLLGASSCQPARPCLAWSSVEELRPGVTDPGRLWPRLVPALRTAGGPVLPCETP